MPKKKAVIVGHNILNIESEVMANSGLRPTISEFILIIGKFYNSYNYLIITRKIFFKILTKIDYF